MTSSISHTEYARLTQHVYEELERKVGTVVVNQITTDLQAGYMLGVQAVLKELRNGYVIPTPASS